MVYMQSDWAAEHLQVIRTLMERSAVYRRALAPVMLVTGGFGTAAAIVGVIARVESPRAFIAYWLAVSIAPLVTALLLVRRQALRASEAFWSPPTRRVAQAVLPCLAGAVAVSAAVWSLAGGNLGSEYAEVLALRLLPLVWIVLYGCASHAAGFFMRRGIRLFGWISIIGGLGAFFAVASLPHAALAGHGVMGFFFGILHFAYGTYLLFTERRTNAT
jgi:hypothetical protein